MQNQNIAYQDKDVRVTNKHVFIKCYFFPTTQEKSINYRDIIKVQIRDLGLGKGRLWGMGVSNWGYWLAGDLQRMNRNQFIAVDNGSSITPSFTCQNTLNAYQAIISQLNNYRAKLLKQQKQDKRVQQDKEEAQMIESQKNK